MGKARDIAVEIVEVFEELLESKGIKIPSEDREGEVEEACIYGNEYYDMEDAITDILLEAGVK